MKSVMCSLLCLCLLGASASEPTVTYVTAQQRYQGNGKVDITVTLTGTSNDVVEAEYTFVATNSATHAALNVAHVTAVDGATGSGSTWTRKFVWNALADVGVVKIDDVVLTVDVESQYVQLWENGPYWAKCNLGASQPEEFGYYFWWGDTIGYKWQNSQWVASDGSKSGFCFEPVNIPTSNKSLAQLQSMGVVDAVGNLQLAYDAAARQWGDDWRMPKVSELNNLANLCSWNWTTNKGVVGFTVTGKGRYSGNSVFFPAAGWGIGAAINDLSVYGCYRTSTMGEAADLANRLCFNVTGYVVHEFSVSWGYPIRPVKSLAATTHLTLDYRGAIVATGLTATQRYPWNGLVDIAVTIQGASNDVVEADYTFVATNSATHAALNVAHVTTVGGITGSGTTWTQKFVWDAKADVGAVKIDDIALTIDATPDVQLWANGPYWAKCNVGATKPEESGYYFWWGDTVGYKWNASNNGWESVKDGTSFSFTSGNCPTYDKTTSQLQSAGYIDASGNLVAAHDAATAHLGAAWRMPTDAEFSALVSNCTTTWTTRNGVQGRLVTGKGAYASKSIFLPAAGYGAGSSLYYLGSHGNYWSSTPNSDGSIYAWHLEFFSGNFYRAGGSYRDSGQSVRPVRGFAQ